MSRRPRRRLPMVIDARAAERGAARHVRALAGDPRPLLVIADEPEPILEAVRTRPAPTIVATGAAGPAGSRAALQVLGGLAGGPASPPQDGVSR